MKFFPTCNKTYTEGQTFCPDEGEVLQEPPESFVYRARHILSGDEVVIKTLRSEMRSNAEWPKRVQGEAARAEAGRPLIFEVRIDHR